MAHTPPVNKPIIDTDSNRIDAEFVNAFLSKTYWAEGRTLQEMHTLIANSLNFGVYLDGQQIGYARVVTDYAQFAYLMDVFITPEHQGKGYAHVLMSAIMDDNALSAVKVWRLATSDAHGLYTKFGFSQLKNPEKLMELIKV